MSAENIVRFLHSRFAAVLIGMAAIACTCVSYAAGDVIPITGSKGLGFPSANSWLPPCVASLVLNLILCTGIALLMIILNKRFNLTHSTSVLISGLFLIMQAALPSVAGQFYGGTLLCVIVMTGAGILFTTFHNPEATKPVFLIFFLLSLCAFTQYAYVMFIPVFFIGCAQMRILNGRSVTAAILGIITPVWILAGFGLIQFSDIAVPEFTDIFTAVRDREILQMSVTTGVTLLLCVITGAGCMLRTYNYNSNGRSFNGFIYVVSIATIILIFVDYTNVATYMPLLNCCTAYHTSHFFAIHARRLSYIGILTVLAVYAGLYTWSILL